MAEDSTRERGRDAAGKNTEAATILVAGTASHVGKSTVAAGLCRLLADRGIDVVPYKAQNMSNNARAVPGGEIGVSQYVQARAARVPATVDTNPVLLKPRGEGESQLVVHGDAVGHYGAGEYYDHHWERALAAARESHERLASDHDVVVAEGAGSIAEPNLRERDLANVETARFADADILLVADIERGGVFASLVGTLELLPTDLRERVVGTIITKFRGQRAILDPALEDFEQRTGVPILGVVPYEDPGLPEEDSVSLPPEGERAVDGRGDGVSEERAVTIAVPRLPRISNFTDFGPLAREPGVRVAYVPLDAPLEADAVVLPGTKNTVDDLLALRESGMADRVLAFDGPVVGLCGGYQMLGRKITNGSLEGTGGKDEFEGLGLLPVETRFEADKQVEPVTREISGVGPLDGATGTVSGYEIHMGHTRLIDDATRPFPGNGAATDRVLGTYLHGLFENDEVRRQFVRNVASATGHNKVLTKERTHEGNNTSPYDEAAGLLEEYVDVDALPGVGLGS